MPTRLQFLLVLLALTITACAMTRGGVYGFRPHPSIRPTPTFWVEPSVRDRLAAEWTDSIGQPERAYCLVVELSGSTGDDTYTVIDYHPALVITANQTSIRFHCPTGQLFLHTHPPQTQVGIGEHRFYVPGGLEANQCWPSAIDQATLIMSNHPFHMVQCSRDALVPYWNPFFLAERDAPHPPPIQPDGTKTTSSHP